MILRNADRSSLLFDYALHNCAKRPSGLLQIFSRSSAIFRHLLLRSLRRQHHFTSLTVAAVAGPSPSHAVAESGSVAVSVDRIIAS